jgi:hypothetical protein
MKYKYQPKKADLSCKIFASHDKKGMELIADGDTIKWGIRNDNPWLHFRLMNLGTKDAKNFQVRMLVAINKSLIYDDLQIASIGPGNALSLPKIYPVEIDFDSLDDDVYGINATMLVDMPKSVPETNEHNNICFFRFNASVIHAPR